MPVVGRVRRCCGVAVTGRPERAVTGRLPSARRAAVSSSRRAVCGEVAGIRVTPVHGDVVEVRVDLGVLRRTGALLLVEVRRRLFEGVHPVDSLGGRRQPGVGKAAEVLDAEKRATRPPSTMIATPTASKARTVFSIVSSNVTLVPSDLHPHSHRGRPVIEHRVEPDDRYAADPSRGQIIRR